MPKRSELIRGMTSREYKTFSLTGATETPRKRNDDYYTYPHNPLPKSELPAYAKPGVLVVKQDGSAKFVETGTEKLDKFYNR